MALIRVDWKPDSRKIRQFGLGIIVFAAILSYWRGPVFAGVGLALGLLCAALPELVGRPVYKAWMGVAFVIGSLMSALIMGFIYFGLMTPLALVMRLTGRDALRLKRPAGESYWVGLSIPEDKSYFERLF